jgi:hypothetical protein
LPGCEKVQNEILKQVSVPKLPATFYVELQRGRITNIKKSTRQGTSNLRVKQSHYRPGQALRVPGG